MPLTVTDVSYDSGSGSILFRASGSAYSVARFVGGVEYALTATPVPSGEMFVDHMAFTATSNTYVLTDADGVAQMLRIEAPRLGRYTFDGTPGVFVTPLWQWVTWGFLSYGPGFETVLRVEEPTIKYAGERARTVFDPIDSPRSRPIFGTRAAQTFDIDATIAWRPGGPERFRPSSVQEWRTASLEAQTVLLRLPDGARIFGYLDSGVDISASDAYTAGLSFSVSESDYQEAPIIDSGATWDSAPESAVWNEV